MTKNKEKLKAQVKSRFYYLFWGIATVSVVAGQFYVGSGYRSYARALHRIFDAIAVEINTDRPEYKFMGGTGDNIKDP